jgi:glutathione S-transferase
MRLYHHPISFNARRAVLTALHLAVPVELVQVDLARRENLTPGAAPMNDAAPTAALPGEPGALLPAAAGQVA